MMNSRCTSRPSLIAGRLRSTVTVCKGWRGGNQTALGGNLQTAASAGLSEATVEFTLLNVMLGLRMYVFFIDAFKVALSRVAVQPNMTSNPAIASRVQANALVGRVASALDFMKTTLSLILTFIVYGLASADEMRVGSKEPVVVDA